MTELNPYELGDDALKWAEAFDATKNENNWTLDQIDVGLMIGWFANAIEVSNDTRPAAEITTLRAVNARHRAALEVLVDCSKTLRSFHRIENIARDAIATP